MRNRFPLRTFMLYNIFKVLLRNIDGMQISIFKNLIEDSYRITPTNFTLRTRFNIIAVPNYHLIK